MPKDNAYLDDILQAAKAIQRFTAGVSLQGFVSNEEKYEAVNRKFQPEFRSWGARPPRALLDAPSRPALGAHTCRRAAETFLCPPSFPRGRGKQRPRRARSPFHFGVRVQIIGEAARRLSPEGRNALLEIPWRLITAMRNILVHDYDDVDLDVVWDTAQKSIPPLIERVEAYLAAHPPPESDGQQADV